MSFDEDIKRSFERHATDVSRRVSWQDVERRIVRAQRRRVLIVGTLAVIAFVSAASVALTMSSERAPDFATDGGAVPSLSREPSASSSPSPPQQMSFPESFVAVVAGRVEVRSSNTGERLRVLVPADADVRRRSLTVSPDRALVYFIEVPKWHEGAPLDVEPCGSVLRKVPFRGGPVETVAKALDVAVSPDGRYLAYTRVGPPDRCSEAPIVVRDLASGTERVWRWTPYPRSYAGPEYTQPQHLAWLPDARHLLFALTVGDPGYDFLLLDTEAGEDILDSRKLEAPDGLFLPAFGSSASRFLAVRQFHHDGWQPDRVLWIDTETGAAEAAFQPDAKISALDFDASGTHLILAVIVSYEDDGPRSRIVRWSGGDVVEIHRFRTAVGYGNVAW